MNGRFGVWAERMAIGGDGTSPVFPSYIKPTAEPAHFDTAGDFYLNSTSFQWMLHNGTFGAPVGGVKRVEILTGATDAWTEADSGTLFLLNRAGGIDITLPALADTDVGVFFDVAVITAASSDTYTITAATGDLLTGRVNAWDTDTANTITSFAPDGSDDLIITLSDTADLPGTRLRLVATSATSWFVTGDIYHTGNSATPFS